MDPLSFAPGVIDGGGLAQLQDLVRESDRLLKALTGVGGTDHAALTGGAALRRESLERTLLSVVEEVKHFVLWRKLAKAPATALIDEWSRITSIGGFPGGAANGELDAILESTGEYERKTDAVKFLMTLRRTSVAAEIQAQNGLVGAIAVETRNGTKEILRSANWLGYYGDKACSSVEFDGLAKILEAAGFVTDLRGLAISSKAEEVTEAAARVWGPDGGFGELTDYFCSPLVQVDLDQKLDPAHRVNIGNNPTNLTIGASVQGIHTTFGDIMRNVDPFIQETQAPWVGRGGRWTTLAAASGVTPPTSIAGVAAADAASKFEASHAGTYYFAVEAASKAGRGSTLRKTAAIVVAAGDKVTLTITEDAGETGTYYVLHRSKKNGTNADADFREFKRIPRAGTGTTVYVDRNDDIPGTSKLFLLENKEESVSYRRLLDMTRFPLFPTNTPEHRWAQLLFCYLRVALPEHNHVLKNILPSGASWQPF